MPDSEEVKLQGTKHLVTKSIESDATAQGLYFSLSLKKGTSGQPFLNSNWRTFWGTNGLIGGQKCPKTTNLFFGGNNLKKLEDLEDMLQNWRTSFELEDTCALWISLPNNQVVLMQNLTSQATGS